MLAGERVVEVIAHRGASGYLPEHTLEAYALAHAMQADYIEQDLVLTADDIPVALHDVHVDTVTNVQQMFPERKRDDGRFYAIDFTLAELKTLNVHERVDHKTGDAVFPARFPVGEGSFSVPTLAEAIELIQGLNQSTGRAVAIYPELKQPGFHHREGKDIARIVLDVLSKYGYQTKTDGCIIQCFEERETKRLRNEFQCQLRLVQLYGSADWSKPEKTKAEIQAKLEEIGTYADGIGPSLGMTFRRNGNNEVEAAAWVQLAQERGLQIHPWTLRADSIASPFQTFAEMHVALKRANIDAVFSDFPDRSVQLLTH